MHVVKAKNVQLRTPSPRAQNISLCSELQFWATSLYYWFVYNNIVFFFYFWFPLFSIFLKTKKKIYLQCKLQLGFGSPYVPSTSLLRNKDERESKNFHLDKTLSILTTKSRMCFVLTINLCIVQNKKQMSSSILSFIANASAVRQCRTLNTLAISSSLCKKYCIRSTYNLKL